MIDKRPLEDLQTVSSPTNAVFLLQEAATPSGRYTLRPLHIEGRDAAAEVPGPTGVLHEALRNTMQSLMARLAFNATKLVF